MFASVLTDIVIPAALGMIGVVAFGGVLWVRFKGGSLDELRDALMTAKYEIDIANQRTHRLELQVADEEKELQKLRTRVQSLESENALLRGAISSGEKLAPEFAEVIVQALNNHEHRSQENYEKMLKREFANFEDRVALRHRVFLNALPGDVGKALGLAIDGEERKRAEEYDTK